MLRRATERRRAGGSHVRGRIAGALGWACRSGAWHRCRCPVHQSGGATLGLHDGPRGLIVHCHAGCSRDEVLAELRRRGLIEGEGSAPADPPDPAEIARRRAAEERNRQRRIADALDFWQHETASPYGTAVEWYWAARGLIELAIPPTIRASQSWLRHPEGGSRPAMIALVEHVEHGPAAIHRTWLQRDGAAKASFREPRRSLGPIKGGAVRLAPAGELLMVSEGIETGAVGNDRDRLAGMGSSFDQRHRLAGHAASAARGNHRHPGRSRRQRRRRACRAYCGTALACRRPARAHRHAARAEDRLQRRAPRTRTRPDHGGAPCRVMMSSA